MLTVQKVLFLRKVDLFADLTTRELGHVARIAREVVFPAGSLIFEEGAYGDALYLIVGGEVTVSRGERTLGVLGEAECFGEMAVLTGEVRSASVRATADCLVLRIERADFQEILADHFEVVLAVIRTLCRRLRTTDQGA
jgi:CRP-like cAMP-binding protein